VYASVFCSGCTSSGTDPQGGSVSVTQTSTPLIIVGAGIGSGLDGLLISGGSGTTVSLDSITFRAAG
jgi:hypothetical protein